jgi:seryl-tRNA synthetase
MELGFLRVGPKSLTDIYRGSQKRRHSDQSVIDQVIILDIEWKKVKFNYDNSKNFINRISKIISKLERKKLSHFLSFLIENKNKIIKIDKLSLAFEEKRNETYFLVGNLIHNSALYDKFEKNSRINKMKRTTLKKKNNIFFNHFDLLNMIEGVDYKKGQIIAGNRAYFLKNFGLLLNKALLRYGLDFLIKKNFIALQTPYFMFKKILLKCSQLEDFSEQLYNLNGAEEKFLIATSEQPISSFHFNEKLLKKNLPLKYVGFSACFRKESGSHGKDTSGIFRVHQFEKIEQFIICSPEKLKSWFFFEELLNNVKEFYSSLHIPFKFLNISSNSLNNSAAKKIDLLGFFPKSNTFRELVSCSNCTYFQSEKLNVKLEFENNNKEFNHPHMLNSTLCATTRVICCIVENFQSKLGIIIPNVLRSYTGLSFIPYKKK